MKLQVVQWLACFKTPSEVVELVKENFKVKITPQAAEGYDPTKAAGKSLSENLKTVFEETRKKFTEELIDIGVAHQTFRLVQLGRMYQKAYERGNYQLAALLLKQAAEERGGMFTNRRELTGRDGSPLLVPLSPEITDALIAGYKEVMKNGSSPG